MKKFTYVLLLTIFLSSISFAQKNSDLERAYQYLKEKGEVIFTFKANTKTQFRELNRILSVSHKHVNDDDLDWVTPLRETHNVPLWMGESGENSNTWYTNFISLLAISSNFSFSAL